MNELPIIGMAISHGTRIAVRSHAGTTTYSELVAGSGKVAHALLDGADDLNQARIAFMVPAGERYIQTQWGIWRAGGIAVPLSLSATEQELRYSLEDSQTRVVVVASELVDRVTSLSAELHIQLLCVDEQHDALESPLPEVAINRPAMILYTSGTTSKPKGVVTSHGCIQAQIESLIHAWHWQQDDRIPLFLPLHHIHGIINVVSCACWAGAEIDACGKFDLETILGRVANHAYTVFMAVPTIYVKLIEALEAMPNAAKERVVQGFAEMRLMVSGSAALPASVHKKWTELTGQKLLERYGMTEIGMALSNPYIGERRPGAVGQPLPSVQIRLQSEKGESIAEEDISGEIQVRGPGVFQRYWNRDDATAESFTDGWFRTGDMAVIEDGYFRIMGRSSVDIIKSGGYKLSALEIEATLLDHPAINECAVVGLPDETWGESVAVAVVLNDQSLELESLQTWCIDRISPYKIPRSLLTTDELPRNAMGKVTKPAVSKMFTNRQAD